MDWSIWLPNLWKATLDTLYMVGVSALFSVFFGLLLGVLLVTTRQRGLVPTPWLYQGIGTIINMVRSLPFIILLIVLIPFPRLVVGTTIGPTAAIVTLALAGIPFFARIAESSLHEVDRGLVEAAQALGCTNWQIVTKVLIPEALPSLILGIALAVISLISYSAMAGAIGGGGLGDLAIRYGYQRFETEIMIVTVVLLIVLVQGVQALGNQMAHKVSKR